MLTTEIFKSKAEVLPELMNDIFHFVERPDKSRSNYILERNRDHIGYHGSESLCSFAPEFWDLRPNSIKNYDSLKEFRTKTKIWVTDYYPLRVCKSKIHFKSFHRFCALLFESSKVFQLSLHLSKLTINDKNEVHLNLNH